MAFCNSLNVSSSVRLSFTLNGAGIFYSFLSLSILYLIVPTYLLIKFIFPIENDKAVVTLDGEEIAIEQQQASASASVKGIGERFSLKGDLTNLYVGDFNGDGKDDFIRQEKGAFDDDNFRTAHIVFSENNGDFVRRTGLAEKFVLKGDFTNLHIGDFNGDGKDDFLRQEKSLSDNDNLNTAHIFFADGNGNFSTSNRTLLPENFDIKGDLTNLHIGDFNGDGNDDFLRQGKPNSGISDRIFFSNGDASFSEISVPSTSLLSSSSANTTISDVGDFNGDGLEDILIQRSISLPNDTFRDTRILFSDGSVGFGGSATLYSGSGNSGDVGLESFGLRQDLTNLHIGDFDGDGVNEILRQEKGSSDDDNRNTTQVFSNLGFDILGGEGNDSINSGTRNDIIDGENGDDTLNGNEENNTFFGGLGNDLLLGRGGNDTVKGGEGNDTLDGGEGQDVLLGGNGNDTLEGESDNDILDGGESNDLLLGGEDNDTLNGQAGEDILEGGAGDDILDGGDSVRLDGENIIKDVDIASYQGNIDGFDINVNDDGTVTVTDIDISDGDEGTDTLTNISQLAFGGNTRLKADSNRNTVLGIAGVHESTNNTDTSNSIIGGNAAATNFVIDIEGTTGLGLDFDTSKLAEFINDITLPDQEIENARLANNLLLDAAGGVAGSIPIFGGAASAAVAMEQTLINYQFDLLQVEAQREATINAVNNSDYNTEAWGTITQTNRDLVLIEDFQIGVDNLFLPSVSDLPGIDVGYAIKSGSLNNENGVFIEAQIGNENSNLVFIKNNYDGRLNNTEFTDHVSNLLKGSVISTVNQTPIQIEPSRFQRIFKIGSFAGDHIIGLELSSQPQDPDSDSGSFELLGRFGDDLIQGGSKDDLLYGGFNSDAPIFANLTYEDDGFDVLQGGKGDDILWGGSGNDTLDGGGLNYNNDPNIESVEDFITGVITDDGTDTLIGGSGNDTFVFNTPETGIDVIRDYEVLVDKIQINKVEFGATDNSQFSFDESNGALSFNSQQFATLENFDSLQDFDVNRDIQLV